MASKRTKHPRRRPARPDRRSILAPPELLEPRANPVTLITVTNTNDSGAGSLRQAILTDNSEPAALPIKFSIAASGVQAISLLSPLPAITKAGVAIEGQTESGYAGTPLIDVDGTNAGAGAIGLEIDANGVTIQGLAIGNFAADYQGDGGIGIQIDAGVSGVLISGDFIGTDPTGTTAEPNSTGLYIAGNSNTIGGTTAAAENVISGNSYLGIDVYPGSDNVIEGNYVGINAAGNAALANGTGILLEEGAIGNTIGGTAAGSANVISGNLGEGIESSSNPGGNGYEGNFIGTNATGTAAIGNGGDGIALFTSSSGDVVSDNLISGNGEYGINVNLVLTGGALIQGNMIGTNEAVNSSLPNGSGGIEIQASTSSTIGGTAAGQGNTISGNLADGIYLNGSGVTGTVVEANDIGAFSPATTNLGNGGDGIDLVGATGNFLGVAGFGNTIGGNSRFGVHIDGGAATMDLVQGNFIGTDAAGDSHLGNLSDGVRIFAGIEDMIGGAIAADGNVISGNAGNGVYINNETVGDTVEGNFIGTDPTGAHALANAGDGVDLAEAGKDQILSNVISGNGSEGIADSETAGYGAVIQGNKIGTDATGMYSVTNGTIGIDVQSDHNTIGGTVAGQGNTISGNSGDGIYLDGAAVSNTLIEGNLIGTDGAGTGPLPNRADGIDVFASSDNTIGGTGSGAGNVISGNAGDGIYIESYGTAATGNLVEGNLIGTDSTGTAAVGNGSDGIFTSSAYDNVVSGNVISANAGFGFHAQNQYEQIDDSIQGNIIGADGSGTHRLGNDQGGIYIQGGGETIGGGAGQGNIISANGDAANPRAPGIEIDQSYPYQVFGAGYIYGNKVGVGATTQALGNDGDGILLLDAGYIDVGLDADGTSTPAEANTIAANGGSGVDIRQTPGSAQSNVVIANSFIGTDANGDSGLGNALDGVRVDGYADVVGSIDTAQGDVISGNADYGVDIANFSGGNVMDDAVDGDIIGMNPALTSALPNGMGGVYVATSGNRIGGTAAGEGDTISGNDGNGISLAGAGSNLIEGNTIGEYPNGVAALKNTGDGIDDVSLGNNTIGGTAVGAGNLIAGNLKSGIILGTYASNPSEGGGDLLEGNFIGTDAAGDTGIGDVVGGLVIESSNNVIGGAASGAGNVIAGNDGGGIVFSDTTIDPTGNAVEGNAIGTTFGLAANLGNFGPAGIIVGSGVTGDTIGGALAADANTIGGNQGDGIDLDVNSGEIVVLNNVIGGPLGNGNGISIVGSSDNVIGEAGAGNTITDNSGAGIEIGFDISADRVGTASYASGQVVGPTAFFNTKAPFGPPTSTQYTSGTPISLDFTLPQSLSGATTGTLTLALYNLGTGPEVAGNYVTALIINGQSVSLSSISAYAFDTVENSAIPISVASGTLSATGITTVEVDFVTISNPGAAGLDYARIIATVPASGNVIQGNFIGTDSMFDPGLGNGADGVDDDAGGNVIGAAQNTSGTSDAASGNVIASNRGFGIDLPAGGSGNDQIRSNFIGTDPAGDLGLGNVSGGILVDDTDGGNVIGAADDLNADGSLKNLHGNVISGNDGPGLEFNQEEDQIPSRSADYVEGNLIGTNPTGESALPNAVGVLIFESDDVIVGNPAAADEANVISGNSGSFTDPTFGGDLGGYGVVVEGSEYTNLENDRIGTNFTGTYAVANSGDGVSVEGSESVYVGVDFAPSVVGGDLISGNGSDGVLIGDGSVSIHVYADLIGTSLSGESAIPNRGDGVEVTGSSTANIGIADGSGGDVISGNAGDGVQFDGTSDGDFGNIYNDKIGTDIFGKYAIANGGDGIEIDSQDGIVIGGAGSGTGNGGPASEGNLISGNVGDGIYIKGSTGSPPSVAYLDQILGNKIGTNLGGSAAVPNQGSGIELGANATAAVIGGVATTANPTPGNLISGNEGDGVALDYGSLDAQISGNTIGTDGTGEFAVPNLNFGIFVGGTSAADDQNTIGGSAAGAGNLISGNGSVGIYFDNPSGEDTVQGNYIGVDRKGTSALANSYGVSDSGSSTEIIGNLISGNTHTGISLQIGSSDLVVGNLIGTDLTGTLAVPNHNDGVLINDGAFGDTIGGSTTAARNVISGNFGGGIVLDGSSPTGKQADVVLGNYIGVDETGTTAVPNTVGGIYIAGNAYEDQIGGASQGDGNVISGNMGGGIVFAGPAYSVVIWGNFIGTNAKGTKAVPNVGSGIAFSDTTAGDSDNGIEIGSFSAGYGNVISGNSSAGIDILGDAGGIGIFRNLIGVDATGMNPLGNGNNGIAVMGGAAQGVSGIDIGSSAGGGTIASADQSKDVIAFNGTAAAGIPGVAITDATAKVDVFDDDIRDNSGEPIGGMGAADEAGSPAVTGAGGVYTADLDFTGLATTTEYLYELFSVGSGGTGGELLAEGMLNTGPYTYANPSINFTATLPAYPVFTAAITAFGAGSTSQYAPGVPLVGKSLSTPVAALAPTLTTTLGVATQFDGSRSTNADGLAISYAWDFGDGTYGTGEYPTHQYTKAGDYTVTLYVYDDYGDDSAAATESVTVLDNPPGFDPSSFGTPTVYPDPAGGDGFGSRVVAIQQGDIDEGGSIFAISAPSGGVNGSGLVYLNITSPIVTTSKSGSGSAAIALADPRAAAGDGFGSAMAVVGTILAVSAPGTAGDGAVYLFDVDPDDATYGSLLATIHSPSPNPAGGSDFGGSLMGDGTSLLVGAADEVVNGVETGSAYVFDADPSDPTFGQLRMTLADPDATAGDGFGTAVASTGADLLVTAPGAGVGSAYEFDTVTGKLLSTFTNPSGSDGFGDSIATSGSIVLVGAPGANGGAGEVDLFDEPDSLPTTLDDPYGSGGGFGSALAGGASVVLVGAPGATLGNKDSGAVFEFDLDPTSATFGHVLAERTDPTPGPGDGFGGSVALLGDDALVGASGLGDAEYIPTVAQLGLSASTVDADTTGGPSVVLSGRLDESATGGDSALVVDIDWGDGSAETVLKLPAGVLTFAAPHTFGSAGQDEIVAAVTDSLGARGTASVPISVDAAGTTLSLGSNSPISQGQSATLGGQFSDPALSAAPGYVIDWGDDVTTTGSLTDGDSPGVFDLDASHAYIQPSPEGDPFEPILFLVEGSGNDVTILGSGTTPIVVDPIDPAVTGLALDHSTITGGGSVDLTGDFTAPNTDDPHTVSIDWGDGTSTTLYLAPGGLDQQFSTTHPYDVNPSPTIDGGEPYAITVSVSGGPDGASGTASTSVTVTHAAPQALITVTPGANSDPDGPVQLVSGTTDTSASDLASATYSWSVDGGQPFGGSTFEYSPGLGGFDLVTLTVTDADGVSTTATAEVIYERQDGMDPPVPVVLGTANQPPPGELVFLNYGDDDTLDGSGASVPVVIDGGPGSDNLEYGGPIANTLIADGSDSLFGGSGTNLFEVHLDGSDPYIEANPQSPQNTLDFSSDDYSADPTDGVTVTLNDDPDPQTVDDNPNDVVVLVNNFQQLIGSTGGSDNLSTGPGDVKVVAGSGKSMVVGGTGNDVIFGGPAGSTVTVMPGPGDTTVDGGAGNDVTFGAPAGGTVTVMPGPGDTTVDATMDGGGGNDVIFGGPVGGMVTVDPGPGGTTVDGGAGNDVTYGGPAGSTTVVVGGSGDTTVDASMNGGMGNDVVYGGPVGSMTVVMSGSGDTTVDGGGGNDVTYGGPAGSMTVVMSGSGDTTVDGGGGNDVTYGGPAGSMTTVNQGSGDSTVDSGSGGTTVSGGSGNDVTYVGPGNASVSGGSGDDTIDGGSGNDTIDAGSGNDVVYAGPTVPGSGTVGTTGGDDSIDGGDGNDVVYTGPGNSTVQGGSGNTTVVGGSGDDTINGGDGSNSVVGGSGNDVVYLFPPKGDPAPPPGTGSTLLGGSGNDVVYDGPNTDLVRGGTGDITVYGYGYDDPDEAGDGGVTTIDGGAGASVIYVGTGANMIAGGSGATTIYAGPGDDTIMAGSGDTTVYGGTGTDLVMDGSGNDVDYLFPPKGDPSPPPGTGSTVLGGSGNDVVYDGPNTDLVRAGTGATTIYGYGYDDPSDVGNGGVTTLEGGTGDATIYGGSGDNRIVGGTGSSVIHGGSGDNTLAGGKGANTIYGGPRDDMIFGGPGTNMIFPGPGSDVIDGTGGTNTLAIAVGGDAALTDQSLTFAGPDGTVTDLLSGAQRVSLLAGPGDEVIDASAFSGSVTLVGGVGDDTLIGSQGGSSLVAGRGDDLLVGGPGPDTFAFEGSTVGNDEVSVPSAGALDSLDFSGLDSPIDIDLALTTPQAVSPGADLTLTLSSSSAIEDLIGTDYDDTIVGNADDDDLIGDGGLDSIVGGTGDDTLQGGVTQVVYLDFDLSGTPGDHVYSPADQSAIQGILEQDYADFDYEFATTPPSSGPFATLYFNPPSLGANEGGIASGIDLRNLDKGDYADISVAGLLGNAGEPADTDANFVALTGEVAAHELGHLSGLLHGDSFGPIGDGIAPGVSPDAFYPAYPGPTDANQSGDHIIASPASIGTSIQDAVDGTFFGEREDILLSFNDHGTATDSETADHSSAADAQPIALAPLSVSNSDELNQDLGKVYQVGAADVVGHIDELVDGDGDPILDSLGGAQGVPDFYAIQGTAGDLLNLQVYSRSLARIPIADQIDSILDVYYYVGNQLVHVPYYGSVAHDDDSFQDQDAAIIDLPLPATTTYYVEVSTYPDDGLSFGDYELFMYAFTPTGTAQSDASEPAGGDTLLGGSGEDLILAGEGDDTIEDDPSRDTVIFGSGSYQTIEGPIDPAIATDSTIADSGAVEVDEGTEVSLAGSYFDPEFNPDSDPDSTADATSWAVIDSNGDEVASGEGTNFDFTPADPDSFTATFSVADALATASTSVAIDSAYVAPTVTAPGDQAATAAASQTFSLGTYSAPAGTTGYEVDVNWGDQSSDTQFAAPAPDGSTPVSLGSVAHAFAAAGPYTVTVSVSQDGLPPVSETFPVVVSPAGMPVNLVSIAPVAPGDRTSAVSTIVATFSEAIQSPFNSAISLTLDGSPISTASLSEAPDASGNYAYDINGLAALTNAEGQYVLTIDPTKVEGTNTLAGTGSTQSVSWIVDRTPPTSRVAPFSSSQGTATATSLNIAVSATGTDPAPSAGVVTSGVAFIEFFVSTNGGAFPSTPFAIVPADANGNGSTTFTAQSNNTYGFYSLAIDGAGNVEVKSPSVETAIYVPDLSPPVTGVTSATPASGSISAAPPAQTGFEVAWSGADGGSAPTVSDSGFESPSVGTGAYGDYVYDPTSTAWTFAGAAGVAGDGSGFIGSLAAPQGTQAAFVQGTGSISQAVTAAAGTYAITFQSSQRTDYGASREDFEVLVDGAVVGTFQPGTAYADYGTVSFALAAGAHTIAFRGVDSAGGDNTAFLDAVSLAPVGGSAPTVSDSGFESPSVGTGAYGDYVYDPTSTAWTFAGAAGVAGDGSGFIGSLAAPQGTQAAFVQGTGSISQAVTAAAGTYAITFQSSQRTDYGASREDFEVLVDGAVVGTFQPGTAYADYGTVSFALAAGAHTIAFRGVDSAGGDNTAFLDAVSLAPVGGPGSGLAGFTLYESIDGGSPVDLGLFYANPGADGVSTGSTFITGDLDGAPHAYQFWTDGVDRAGNVQTVSTPYSITETFAAPASTALQATGLLVQDGAVSRSYVRYLSIDFDSLTDAALESLVAGNDITLIHHPISGAISASDPSIVLDNASGGPAVTALDHQIDVDFGPSGIGGSAASTTPDGYYEIDIALPDGATQKLFFYRLLGDVDGSQAVDSADVALIAGSLGLVGPDLDADVNGDAVVNSADTALATRSKGRQLGSGPGSLQLDG